MKLPRLNKRKVPVRPAVTFTENEGGSVQLKLVCHRHELVRDPKTGNYIFADEEFRLSHGFEVEPGIICPVRVRLLVEAIPWEDQKAQIEALLQSERENVVIPA